MTKSIAMAFAAKALSRSLVRRQPEEKPTQEEFPIYWGDWSGYCGIGNGRVADWIKKKDPTYNR